MVCCACAPVETVATAIKLATVDTVLPVAVSKLLPKDFRSATERNDRGVFIMPITRPTVLMLPLVALRQRDALVLSGVFMGVNAISATLRLNPTISKQF